MNLPADAWIPCLFCGGNLIPFPSAEGAKCEACGVVMLDVMGSGGIAPIKTLMPEGKWTRLEALTDESL